MTVAACRGFPPSSPQPKLHQTQRKKLPASEPHTELARNTRTQAARSSQLHGHTTQRHRRLPSLSSHIFRRCMPERCPGSDAPGASLPCNIAQAPSATGWRCPKRNCKRRSSKRADASFTARSASLYISAPLHLTSTSHLSQHAQMIFIKQHRSLHPAASAAHPGPTCPPTDGAWRGAPPLEGRLHEEAALPCFRTPSAREAPLLSPHQPTPAGQYYALLRPATLAQRASAGAA